MYKSWHRVDMSFTFYRGILEDLENIEQQRDPVRISQCFLNKVCCHYHYSMETRALLWKLTFGFLPCIQAKLLITPCLNDRLREHLNIHPLPVLFSYFWLNPFLI